MKSRFLNCSLPLSLVFMRSSSLNWSAVPLRLTSAFTPPLATISSGMKSLISLKSTSALTLRLHSILSRRSLTLPLAEMLVLFILARSELMYISDFPLRSRFV